MSPPSLPLFPLPPSGSKLMSCFKAVLNGPEAELATNKAALEAELRPMNDYLAKHVSAS